MIVYLTVFSSNEEVGDDRTRRRTATVDHAPPLRGGPVHPGAVAAGVYVCRRRCWQSPTMTTAGCFALMGETRPTLADECDEPRLSLSRSVERTRKRPRPSTVGETHQSSPIIVIIVVSRHAAFRWSSAFTNHERLWRG